MANGILTEDITVDIPDVIANTANTEEVMRTPNVTAAVGILDGLNNTAIQAADTAITDRAINRTIKSGLRRESIPQAVKNTKDEMKAGRSDTGFVQGLFQGLGNFVSSEQGRLLAAIAAGASQTAGVEGLGARGGGILGGLGAVQSFEVQRKAENEAKKLLIEQQKLEQQENKPSLIEQLEARDEFNKQKEQRKKIDDINKSMAEVSSVRSAFRNMKEALDQLPPGVISAIQKRGQAAIQDISGKGGKEAELVSKFEKNRKAVISALTRARGEKGVLTNIDIKTTEEALPQLGESATSRQEGFRAFSDLLDSKIISEITNSGLSVSDVGYTSFRDEFVTSDGKTKRTSIPLAKKKAVVSANDTEILVTPDGRQIVVPVDMVPEAIKRGAKRAK